MIIILFPKQCKKNNSGHSDGLFNLIKKIKIVIDGNRQNIEQSTDKKGNFYKVYCDKEK